MFREKNNMILMLFLIFQTFALEVHLICHTQINKIRAILAKWPENGVIKIKCFYSVLLNRRKSSDESKVHT